MPEKAFEALCADLISVLDRLLEECEVLYKLTLEKQEVLSARTDVDALREVTSREENQSALVARIEKDRLGLASEIARLSNLDPNNVTVSDIATISGNMTGSVLTSRAKSLTNLLEKIKDGNAFNRELIEIKMSFAAFMLDAFAKSDESPTNMYGANGQEDSFEGEVHRIFDSKA